MDGWDRPVAQPAGCLQEGPRHEVKALSLERSQGPLDWDLWGAYWFWSTSCPPQYNHNGGRRHSMTPHQACPSCQDIPWCLWEGDQPRRRPWCAISRLSPVPRKPGPTSHLSLLLTVQCLKTHSRRLRWLQQDPQAARLGCFRPCSSSRRRTKYSCTTD